MHITHSFLGTTVGQNRCLFFLLLKDYIQAEERFVRHLEPSLNRFARSLCDGGALVRPFAGDIEITRQHVLEKCWSPRELDAVRKTPSLLMINEDFDSFDPHDHAWMLLHFDQTLDDGAGLLVYGATLERLAETVLDPDTDIFEVAQALARDISLRDTIDVFEAKPGVFGFSVNLIEGVRAIGRFREDRVGRS